MTVKLLLDTDIGSYIDDALSLAYLLARDDCELLGITTVGGEADRRAMLASTLCWAAGQAVPIIPGAEAPLSGPQALPHAPQAAALLRWPHQTEFPSVSAADFLRRAIRSNPGEVVLLAIGPLTNVAQTVSTDPEVAGLLRMLVTMGGVFTAERRAVEPWERNTSADPHAAAIVYRTRFAHHRSIGLDVSRRATVPGADVQRRLRGEKLGPVREFAEAWFDRPDSVSFSDPLAAATIFDACVCGFEWGNVQVRVARSPRAPGGTIAITEWTPGGHDPAHEVAFDVDAGRFFRNFWAALG